MESAETHNREHFICKTGFYSLFQLRVDLFSALTNFPDTSHTIALVRQICPCFDMGSISADQLFRSKKTISCRIS